MKPELSERLFIEELFNKSKVNLENKSLELQSIERLTGDASTRRYYRLFTSTDTFVVCIDNPTEDEFNSFVRMQEFLSKNNIRVPKILDQNLQKGYLLEEDLGDTTFLKHLATIDSVDAELDQYSKAIDSLIKMHLIKIDSSTLKKIPLSFDYDKLISEMEFTDKFFVKKFLKVEDERTSRNLINFFSPICNRLSQEKMVFTHRDFHSRNIMIKDDEQVIIDFQDARMGIPQYDLVSVLEDCYYDISRNNKYKLIKYYFDSISNDIHGQGDFDSFMKLYNDMTLQRVFKAIGSFAYIYELRQDVRYIKYIGHAMEKLKKVMISDSRYDDLRKLLFGIYYES